MQVRTSWSCWPARVDLEPKAPTKDLPQLARGPARALYVACQQRPGHRSPPTAREADQARGVGGQVLQREGGRPGPARPGPGQVRPADQPAEIGIAAPVLGQQQQVICIPVGGVPGDGDRIATGGRGDLYRNLSTHDGPKATRARGPPKAHRPIETIVVGEGQRRVAQGSGPLDQGLG
jgi:hypothetical protein